MNKLTQAIVVTLLGGALQAITITGKFTAYVRPGLGPLLVIAGLILVLVGVISAVSVLAAQRRQDEAMVGVDPPSGALSAVGDAVDVDAAGADPPPPTEPTTGDPQGNVGHVDDGDDHDHDHDHDHSRSRAPWLILAPVLVLLLMAPPALGAAAVTRNAGSQALDGLDGLAPADPDSGPVNNDGSGGKDSVSGMGGAPAGGGGGGYAFNDGSGRGEGTEAFAKKRPTRQFPALPAGTNPAIGIKEFVMRALYDGAESVTDNSVTVTGFIAAAGDGYQTGYSIARLVVSCCAADATPMRLHVEGNPPAAENTWVTAVVTADSGTATADNDYVPTVTVKSIQTTSEPSDPYEH